MWTPLTAGHDTRMRSLLIAKVAGEKGHGFFHKSLGHGDERAIVQDTITDHIGTARKKLIAFKFTYRMTRN